MIKKSENVDQIIPSLVKAQSQFLKAEKTAPGHYGKFAGYEDIEKAIKKALNENGITFFHEEGEPIPAEKHVPGDGCETIMDHEKLYYPVSTYLYHESAQFLSTSTTVPLDMSADNQRNQFTWAANLTYIKRNQLASICGLVTGDPDPEDKTQPKPKDAKGAVKKAQSPKRRPAKTDDEKFAIEKLEEKKTIEEIEKFQEVTLAKTDDRNFITWFNTEVAHYKGQLGDKTK